MYDDSGKMVKKAEPSTPVVVTGWKSLPAAGDEVLEAENEVINLGISMLGASLSTFLYVFRVMSSPF
jgi:translation initiation factor IF-2